MGYPAAMSPDAPPPRSFADLGLNDEILNALWDDGYDEPMEVQAQAIPIALDGRDLIACAPTGTGKTAAFVLPTLQKIAHKKGLRALVLSPTRELAIQIYTAARRYGRYTEVLSTLFYGGMPLVEQDQQLALDPNLVISTPGRLLDFLYRRVFDLLDVEVLILDEADRMLDMGFMPAIENILVMLPEDRQTLLFSATMPETCARLARRAVRDPVEIRVRPREISKDSAIRHAVLPVEERVKDDLLLAILDERKVKSAVIFVRTKKRVEIVAGKLTRARYRTGRLHSDRSQEHRERTLLDFRDGKIQILVATDVASRGLDIDHISHVINYDVPLDPDDYVHRAGRTGRMHGEGEALTLATRGEANLLRKIEKHTGASLPVEVHPRWGYRGSIGSGAGSGRSGGGRSRGGGGGNGGRGGGGGRRRRGPRQGRQQGGGGRR